MRSNWAKAGDGGEVFEGFGACLGARAGSLAPVAVTLSTFPERSAFLELSFSLQAVMVKSAAALATRIIFIEPPL
jgi:hypothetical protein